MDKQTRIECTNCKGDGLLWRTDFNGEGRMSEECPVCKGEGEVNAPDYTPVQQPYSDELEKLIGITLNECDIKFERNQRLDFYLPDYGVYLEVKKYHSERSESQLASQENIIFIQGKEAVAFFCRALTGALSSNEAKSPTDAVAFAYWMANNNVKILQAHPDVWTYEDAYKLFNPSGAAPQAEVWAIGDRAMDNMIKDSESLKAAPQAAGPVWVKASVRYPKKGIHCAGKYKGKHYDIIVDDLDNILVSGTLFLSNKILQEWYPGIEWLDESGQRLFTREQVAEFIKSTALHFTVINGLTPVNQQYLEKWIEATCMPTSTETK